MFHMSFVVIIRGPLGVGKTSVAKKIAFILSAHYFSIDSIVDSKKVSKIISRDTFIAEKTFLEANKMLVPKVKSLLKRKKIVVIEGSFYRRKALTELVKKCGRKTYVITLSAPLSTCIARDKKRRKSQGKDITKGVYEKFATVKYGKYIDTSTLTVQTTVDHVICHVASKLEKTRR